MLRNKKKNNANLQINIVITSILPVSILSIITNYVLEESAINILQINLIIRYVSITSHLFSSIDLLRDKFRKMRERERYFITSS